MTAKKYSFIFTLIVLLSGFAGLSYELIWIRTIKGYFGSELLSVSLVVSLYFAGLGLGGLVGSFFLRKGVKPLKFYALVELVLAVFGLLFPFLIKGFYNLYLSISLVAPAAWWLFIKVGLLGLLLIVPTTLIGTTLPLIAAVVVDRPQVFTYRFSRFYGLNTFGAVAGCLLTGFRLIPRLGLLWSGYVIVAFNIAAALLCWFFEKIHHKAPQKVIYRVQSWKEAVFPGVIAFLMGFLALTYEIVWIRLFGFYFISTTPSLALLLALFLVGLAAGSALLSFWKKKVTVTQLAWLEVTKAATMIVIYFVIRHLFFHNWGTIAQNLASNPDFINLIKYYLVFGSIAFLLPGLLMGMTFPLVERIWPAERAGSGHVIGIVSAWNTWGGTLGAAFAGLIAISAFGSTNTLLLAVLCSVLIGTILFLYRKKVVPVGFAIVFAVLVVFMLPREMNYRRKGGGKLAYDYYKEGRGCSVSVIKNQFGEKSLYANNSYVLGGTSYKGIKTQLRQGALPVILNPSPSKKSLKIGLGTGVTLAAMAYTTANEQVDAVEILPEVIDALVFFSDHNKATWKKPDVAIHEGDGREFLAMSEEKYDVILAELYTPQSAGTGNLYSAEHLNNIQDHLAPDGIFCQCLQLAQFSKETFDIVVRTFVHVFGEGSLWLVNTNFEMPLVALVAGKDPVGDIQTMDQLLRQFDRDITGRTGWQSALDVAPSFVTDDLESLVKNESRINTLNRPYIEELAPRLTISKSTSAFTWFFNQRKWPTKWRNWEKGRRVWQDFGRAVALSARTIYHRRTTAAMLNDLFAQLAKLPDIPAMNYFKAEVLATLVETKMMREKILAQKDEQMTYAVKMLEQAVKLDPNNYQYRYNLYNIYRLTDQKIKSEQAFEDMWAILPDDVKNSPVFRDFKVP